jgi:hypothetical protein
MKNVKIILLLTSFVSLVLVSVNLFSRKSIPSNSLPSFVHQRQEVGQLASKYITILSMKRKLEKVSPDEMKKEFDTIFGELQRAKSSGDEPNWGINNDELRKITWEDIAPGLGIDDRKKKMKESEVEFSQKLEAITEECVRLKVNEKERLRRIEQARIDEEAKNKKMSEDFQQKLKSQSHAFTQEDKLRIDALMIRLKRK